MERQIQDLQRLSKKAKTLIKQAAKKGDLSAARMYAKEYRNVEKAEQRMYLSKATLQSIGMKLSEQQQLIKIKGSMQKSTAIMRDMNTLVHLPEMSRSIQQLSKELTKSGVIDEMVDDIIDENDWQEEDEDEDEEAEINKIVDSALQESKEKTAEKLPEAPPPQQEQAPSKPEKQSVSPEDEAMLANMRKRLNALEE